ncbi:hypothetical protein CARUB_v10015309mg, partial [Capsella rubella]
LRHTLLMINDCKEKLINQWNTSVDSFSISFRLVALPESDPRRCHNKSSFPVKKFTLLISSFGYNIDLQDLVGESFIILKLNVFPVNRWHAVASWTWDAQDETCGICRMAFDGCCPDCKLPGDDCPLIWGACNHTFHLHCILKWVNSQTSQAHCPMCRREWQFKE